MTPHRPPIDRPLIDAVVFDPRTLLDPSTPATGAGRPRPGSRRLLEALACQGFRLGVLADASPEPGSSPAAPAQPSVSPEPTAPGTPPAAPNEPHEPTAPGPTPTRPDEFAADRLARQLADAGLATDSLRVGPAAQLATHGIIDGERTLVVVPPAGDPRNGRSFAPGGPSKVVRPSVTTPHRDAADDPNQDDRLSVTTPHRGTEHRDAADDPSGSAVATGGVTRPPQAFAQATVVVCPPDEPVHQAMYAALAEEHGPFATASRLCGPLDDGAVRAAEQHQRRLTKPPGSLGRIEALGAQLAGIAGTMPPPLPRPAAIAVFAGDHGVHRQGVSPWPQEVTTQMVANFLGGGAAINVLARQADAEVVVVDVGVGGNLAPAAGLLDRKVRRGTADLSTEPAMTPDEARRALDVGAEVAARLVGRGARCLVTGDMGIANTTPSAALVAALTGRPAADVTGRGTGIADDLLARKTTIVDRAAARARERHRDDPLGMLAEVGGLEHAALAGFVVGGVALQVPVVLDGVIAAASLLVAARLVPGVEHGVVAGHRSVEPGAAAVLDELGLEPLLDLELRLGEGTGAALALPLVEASARILDEMATFDQAGVSDKSR